MSSGEKNVVSNEIYKAESELRLLSRKLIDTIEAERKKIAIDLHDEVGKSLTILQCDLNIIDQAFYESEDKYKKHCENAIREAKQLARIIRKTCSRLRPDLLDDLGLASAIEFQIENLNDQMENLTLTFECNTYDRRPESDTELTLYRVFQEAISNVVRHAQAEHVHVSLIFDTTAVSLEIHDDGVGFHPDERGLPKNCESAGIGLLSMKERVLSLNGQIEIDSNKKCGTSINVVLPLQRVRV
jgi:signal transduction histidine kinase